MTDPHQPSRPSWRCAEDGEPWPCSLARKQLREAFLDNEEELARHMAWLQVAAAQDLAIDEPARLYRRFVLWTSDEKTVCGRCGKPGHQALPGLPPRLFPCRLRQR